MTLEEIRHARCLLENELGRLLRQFENDYAVTVSGVSYGTITVKPIGETSSEHHQECLIHLTV